MTLRLFSFLVWIKYVVFLKWVSITNCNLLVGFIGCSFSLYSVGITDWLYSVDMTIWIYFVFMSYWHFWVGMNYWQCPVDMIYQLWLLMKFIEGISVTYWGYSWITGYSIACCNLLTIFYWHDLLILIFRWTTFSVGFCDLFWLYLVCGCDFLTVISIRLV